MNQISDEELAFRFSQQPKLYFEAVYNRYSDPLFRIIFRFTGNQEAADEILHDTFTQLILGRFTASASNGSLKSWLFTVAKNKSLNHVKQLELRKPLNIQHEDLPAENNNAEAELNNKSLLTQLSLALANLPDDLGELWRLRKHGLDNNQIAERLNIPVGTVKSRFFRLVEVLRKEFRHET